MRFGSVTGRRDGIEPEAAERVATRQAARGQPRAATGAVLLERLAGVLGAASGYTGTATAGGMSTAGRGLRFVAEHARAVTSSWPILTQRAKRVMERGRQLRVAGRARGGAGAHEVGVAGHQLVGVGPRRGAEAPAHPVAHDGAPDPAADGVRHAGRLRARSDDRDVTINTPRRRRRPWASARNVDRSRIGQIRPTGGSGPWTDGGAAPRGRPSSASAGGNRASCFACGCSVETSSSRMASSNARATTRWGPGARRATQVTAREQRQSVRRSGSDRQSALPCRPAGDRGATTAARNPPESALVSVVHSADMFGDPGCPESRTRHFPTVGPTDRGRDANPGHTASAHMWTHLWTTLGSRHRGHTCSR